MNSIVELLKLVKERPAMYIGKNMISCLKAFLDGWYLRNPDGIIDVNIMGAFQDYIEKKYNQPSYRSWCDILLYISQDESIALDLFFEEFFRLIEQNSDNIKGNILNN